MRRDSTQFGTRAVMVLAALIATTMLALGFLVMTAQASADSTSSTVIGQTFQVKILNSSVIVSSESAATVYFQVTAPVQGTFYFGVLANGIDGAAVLAPQGLPSLPDGIESTSPTSGVISGTTFTIPVTLSTTGASVPSTVPLNFAIFEYEGGTYVGQTISFNLGVS
jgi:hypothetical protein